LKIREICLCQHWQHWRSCT